MHSILCPTLDISLSDSRCFPCLSLASLVVETLGVFVASHSLSDFYLHPPFLSQGLPNLEIFFTPDEDSLLD